MDINKVDLNLLRVFDQLMVERSVSGVAESIGLSQPAVSNALQRLRKLFGDDLFQRTARGMQPTPLAEQLAEPIAYALDTIRSCMNYRVSFDPATSRRNFVLSVTDIGEMYFLPPLLARILDSAPGVTFSTVRNTSHTLKEDLEAGRVDLAMGNLPKLTNGFHRQRLFKQGIVCAFRKEHPLAKNKVVTLEEFSAYSHVVVVSAGTGHGEIDRIIEQQGIERKIKLTVPHFIAVGHILQSTDLIATLPMRMVQRVAEPFGLSYLPHPAKLPQVSVDVFWHATVHRDAGNQWLRRMIYELFADAA